MDLVDAMRFDAVMTSLAIPGMAGPEIAEALRSGGYNGPLLALTQHLFISFTEREILEQTIVPMDGREAMHTVMRAKLDGVPKVFDVYVLKKDGCVYDLVGIWAVGKYEPHRAAFESFASGFHTLSQND